MSPSEVSKRTDMRNCKPGPFSRIICAEFDLFSGSDSWFLKVKTYVIRFNDDHLARGFGLHLQFSAR